MITAEKFDALFDSFRATVYRLETLPAYDVGGAEAARIAAWRAGQARPEQSVRTQPWLARIAMSTLVDGKRWARTRILDDPLTEYQRFQLDSMREAQVVGTEMRVAHRSDVGDGTGPDFWLFDAGLDEEHAVVMHYDEVGHWLGADLTTDPSVLTELAERRAAADAVSVPLNEFLAGRG